MKYKTYWIFVSLSLICTFISIFYFILILLNKCAYFNYPTVPLYLFIALLLFDFGTQFKENATKLKLYLLLIISIILFLSTIFAYYIASKHTNTLGWPHGIIDFTKDYLILLLLIPLGRFINKILITIKRNKQ